LSLESELSWEPSAWICWKMAACDVTMRSDGLLAARRTEDRRDGVTAGGGRERFGNDAVPLRDDDGMNELSVFLFAFAMPNPSAVGRAGHSGARVVGG